MSSSNAHDVTSALSRALELGEVGIQAAAYRGNELVVDGWAGVCDAESGIPVQAETLFPVFSVTKAVAVTALHMQVDRGFLNYEDKVAEHWPEYGVNGKEETTVRDALTHRSGAPQMPRGVTPELQADWDWMVEQVAAETPMFPPAERSAYNSIVFGWLIGEIVRRTDPAHRDFGRFVREEICQPLGIEDLWLGVPAEHLPRVAKLSTVIPEVVEDDPVGIAARPPAVALTPAIYNLPIVSQTTLGGSGGIMSARGLARFWAMIANLGELDGVRLLSADMVRSFVEHRANTYEMDAVWQPFDGPLDLSIGGYWRSDTVAGSSPGLLCHTGQGGCIGWADIETGVSGAIVHNRMFPLAPLTEDHPFNAIRQVIERATS